MQRNRIQTRKSLDRLARIQELMNNRKEDKERGNGYEDKDHPSYNNTKL